MTELFSEFDINNVVATCNQRGAPYGLHFGNLRHLSNSRLALEAAEFARDYGKYDIFHHAVFKAYFTNLEDIGDHNVLHRIARTCGIDPTKLQTALDEKRYSRHITNGSKLAQEAQVTAIPTFVIEGKQSITGAVHEDRLRSILETERKNS
jgi:predicted DsbA family dithiol-disulfide isomerase